MKRALLLFLCVCMLPSAAAQESVDLDDAAQRAQEGMRDTFLTELRPGVRMLADHAPPAPGAGFNYWWHAHVLDALLDGFERTGDAAYLDLAREDTDGVRMVQRGTLFNNYYDDMAWMALALLRWHDLTGEEMAYKQAQALWHDIKGGWNKELGGIAWRKSQRDYRNTPANAPSAILGYRMHAHTGRPDDLAWAERICAWQLDTLVDRETGHVHDGINRLGNGAIDRDWVFTYNYGTVIGMLVERCRALGDQGDLDFALKVAHSAKEQFFSELGGVMAYEGEKDAGLFRGIFFRYLEQLALELPQERWLDELAVINATAIAQNALDDTGRVGAGWMRKPGKRIDLAQQSCAVMTLELGARAQRRLQMTGK